MDIETTSLATEGSDSLFFSPLSIKNANLCNVMDLVTTSSTDSVLNIHQLNFDDSGAIEMQEKISITVDNNATVLHSKWKPDGKFIVSGTDSGSVELIDVEKASVIHKIHTNKTPVTSLQWIKIEIGKTNSVLADDEVDDDEILIFQIYADRVKDCFLPLDDLPTVAKTMVNFSYNRGVDPPMQSTTTTMPPHSNLRGVLMHKLKDLGISSGNKWNNIDTEGQTADLDIDIILSAHADGSVYFFTLGTSCLIASLKIPTGYTVIKSYLCSSTSQLTLIAVKKDEHETEIHDQYNKTDNHTSSSSSTSSTKSTSTSRSRGRRNSKNKSRTSINKTTIKTTTAARESTIQLKKSNKRGSLTSSSIDTERSLNEDLFLFYYDTSAITTSKVEIKKLSLEVVAIEGLFQHYNGTIQQMKSTWKKSVVTMDAKLKLLVNLLDSYDTLTSPQTEFFRLLTSGKLSPALRQFFCNNMNEVNFKRQKKQLLNACKQLHILVADHMVAVSEQLLFRFTTILGWIRYNSARFRKIGWTVDVMADLKSLAETLYLKSQYLAINVTELSSNVELVLRWFHSIITTLNLEGKIDDDNDKDLPEIEKFSPDVIKRLKTLFQDNKNLCHSTQTNKLKVVTFNDLVNCNILKQFEKTHHLPLNISNFVVKDNYLNDLLLQFDKSTTTGMHSKGYNGSSIIETDMDSISVTIQMQCDKLLTSWNTAVANVNQVLSNRIFPLHNRSLIVPALSHAIDTQGDLQVSANETKKELKNRHNVPIDCGSSDATSLWITPAVVNYTDSLSSLYVFRSTRHNNNNDNNNNNNNSIMIEYSAIQLHHNNDYIPVMDQSIRDLGIYESDAKSMKLGVLHEINGISDGIDHGSVLSFFEVLLDELEWELYYNDVSDDNSAGEGDIQLPITLTHKTPLRSSKVTPSRQVRLNNHKGQTLSFSSRGLASVTTKSGVIIIDIESEE